MPSPSLHGSPDPTEAITAAKRSVGVSSRSSVRVTVIVQKRCALDTDLATGRQIKEKADVPPGFALYRRVRGGNELIADDAQVELRDGDHFFARPGPGAP
jgi:hypothetical protein